MENLIQKLLAVIGQFFVLVGQVFDDLSQGLSNLVTWPIRDALRAIKHAKNGDNAQWGVILTLPVSGLALLAGLCGRILLSPTELIVSISRRQVKGVLWTLPTTIILFTSIYYVGVSQGWLGAEVRIARLKRSASTAFESQDYVAAAEGFQKLIDLDPQASNEDLFKLYTAYQKSLQPEAANKILKRLAPGPNSTPGYPRAHAIVAIKLSEFITQPIDPGLATEIRWHLNSSGESDDFEHNMAWANYLLAVNLGPDAIEHLLRVKDQNPQAFLMVASIYEQLGKKNSRIGALQDAEVAYGGLLQKQPSNAEVRAIYSSILIELEHFEEAEKELKRGLEMSQNEKVLKDTLSNLHLRLAQNKNLSTTLKQQLSSLRKSLEYNSDQIQAHDSIISLYRSMDNQAEKDAVLAEFKQKADFKPNSSLAHFTLGNFLKIDGNEEESLKHMEFALKSDTRLAAVANNLAWLLCHKDKPELDRARELAESAVQQAPGNPLFRDTLGTVLMEQGNLTEAINEFELALPSMDDKPEVHRKLALIYKQLDMAELAEIHRIKSLARE